MISLADWKRHKAKTLLKESVSDALKRYEEEADSLRSSADDAPAEKSIEAMSACQGANKNLQVAIQATLKQCNATLHKQTIEYLKQLERDVKDAYAAMQKEQVEYNRRLKIFQDKRKEAIASLTPVLKNVQVSTVKTAYDALDDIIKVINENGEAGYKSEEITRGMMSICSSLGTLERLLKMQEKRDREAAARGAKPLPISPAEAAEPLAEVADSIKKLGTLGGFYPPRVRNALIDIGKA